MEKTIKRLSEALKDTEYKQGWIANIAMSYIDCEDWYRKENNKVGKYLNNKDKHTIANNSANHFLNILSKDVSKNVKTTEWIETSERDPKEGSYLCFMENCFVKMCYFNGDDWLDMWETTLKGNVKRWMVLPK